MSEKKVIKYFGAHYCPFSNSRSRAYNLINNLITNKYPDIEIELYMSDDINEENKKHYMAEFRKADAKYVPTVTNDKYAHINLSLPKDYITDDKTDEEITESLLENIYNQLDKEPEHYVEHKVEEFTDDSNDNSNNNSKDCNPKGIVKNTFGMFNNDSFVKIACLLLILTVIFLPVFNILKNKKLKSNI
jgi:hypothetical protein